LAFDEPFDAVLTVHARHDPLDRAVLEMTTTAPFAVVDRLCCLRTVRTLTGARAGGGNRWLAPVHRLLDWLVPRAGAQRDVQRGAVRAGAITKTGNRNARRLVEAAWHHRKPYRPSRELIRRLDGGPAAVRDRAEHSSRRLHGRWARLDLCGKSSTISAVAVARELPGWCCAGDCPHLAPATPQQDQHQVR
jgi:hypothetical protein